VQLPLARTNESPALPHPYGTGSTRMGADDAIPPMRAPPRASVVLLPRPSQPTSRPNPDTQRPNPDTQSSFPKFQTPKLAFASIDSLQTQTPKVRLPDIGWRA